MLIHYFGFARAVINLASGDRRVNTSIDLAFIANNRELQSIGIKYTPMLLDELGDTQLLVGAEMIDLHMFTEISTVGFVVILDVELWVHNGRKGVHSFP